MEIASYSLCFEKFVFITYIISLSIFLYFSNYYQNIFMIILFCIKKLGVYIKNFYINIILLDKFLLLDKFR